MSRTVRIVVDGKHSLATTREVRNGLMMYNREKAGSPRYSRNVVSAMDAKGMLLGGLVLQSYWLESFIELLWVSPKARLSGTGTKLVREAERIARKRGSHLIHLNTFSFQAPGFYQKLGYRRFGSVSGSPRGESREYYVKRLGR